MDLPSLASLSPGEGVEWMVSGAPSTFLVYASRDLYMSAVLYLKTKPKTRVGKNRGVGKSLGLLTLPF